MRIIAFAWTTPAVLADRKHRTRRDWDDVYAGRLRKGDNLQAWDHSPRTGKGKKVAEIVLTADPFKQPINLLTDRDYELEGFAYLQEKGLMMKDQSPRQFFEDWKAETESKTDLRPKEYWVIDFMLDCSYCRFIMQETKQGTLSNREATLYRLHIASNHGMDLLKGELA